MVKMFDVICISPHYKYIQVHGFNVGELQHNITSVN